MKKVVLPVSPGRMITVGCVVTSTLLLSFSAQSNATWPPSDSVTNSLIVKGEIHWITCTVVEIFKHRHVLLFVVDFWEGLEQGSTKSLKNASRTPERWCEVFLKNRHVLHQELSQLNIRENGRTLEKTVRLLECRFDSKNGHNITILTKKHEHEYTLGLRKQSFLGK